MVATAAVRRDADRPALIEVGGGPGTASRGCVSTPRLSRPSTMRPVHSQSPRWSSCEAPAACVRPMYWVHQHSKNGVVIAVDHAALAELAHIWRDSVPDAIAPPKCVLLGAAGVSVAVRPWESVRSLDHSITMRTKVVGGG